MRRFGSTPSDSLSTPGDRVDHVVYALALERRHRLQPYRLAVLLDLLGGVLGDRGEFLAPGGPVAADVEQQPARRTGLPEDRQPGQLLQRLQRGAALADEGCSRAPTTSTIGRPADDQLVDVAVVVEDVEQALDVVGRDLALPEQVALARRRVSGSLPSSSAHPSTVRGRRRRSPRRARRRRSGCWCRSRSHLRTRSAGPLGSAVSRSTGEGAVGHGQRLVGAVSPAAARRRGGSRSSRRRLFAASAPFLGLTGLAPGRRPGEPALVSTAGPFFGSGRLGARLRPGRCSARPAAPAPARGLGRLRLPPVLAGCTGPPAGRGGRRPCCRRLVSPAAGTCAAPTTAGRARTGCW